jgi:hypothetical protein
MASKSYWRKIATPIIAKVLIETVGKEEAVIRKALKDAYPFGERSYHPYKIWLDEVQKQRGIKKRKRTGKASPLVQLDLFKTCGTIFSGPGPDQPGAGKIIVPR